ncbi:hypothetical protein GIB67_016581 [Kingdonia uniflora]|uniref:Calcineurin-like phosphoesterase domain-containing protein n=1 Tax=Kingdonia uniflora TaxID=39325 RepID=A0A7J7MYZ8_9MAGN|nr:hypothetical protein GIB67_016581 [Kingdonia uniflora]
MMEIQRSQCCFNTASLVCFLLLFTVANSHLQFSSSGAAFKIMLFADLHYGKDAWTDWGPLQDVKYGLMMSKILDREIPDFVVYLGDVVTANNVATANASLYWDQAIDPTRSRGIPWAIIFGNHDDASFEWPIDWFSPTGIPQILCPSTNSAGEQEDCSFKGT